VVSFRAKRRQLGLLLKLGPNAAKNGATKRNSMMGLDFNVCRRRARKKYFHQKKVKGLNKFAYLNSFSINRE